MQFARNRAIIDVRRNERRNRYTGRGSKEFRNLKARLSAFFRQPGMGREITHFCYSSNILIAGLFVKAEVFVQSESDIIAVETEGILLQMEQVLLKSTRNC